MLSILHTPPIQCSVPFNQTCRFRNYLHAIFCGLGANRSFFQTAITNRNRFLANRNCEANCRPVHLWKISSINCGPVHLQKSEPINCRPVCLQKIVTKIAILIAYFEILMEQIVAKTFRNFKLRTANKLNGRSAFNLLVGLDYWLRLEIFQLSKCTIKPL